MTPIWQNAMPRFGKAHAETFMLNADDRRVLLEAPRRRLLELAPHAELDTKECLDLVRQLAELGVKEVSGGARI